MRTSPPSFIIPIPSRAEPSSGGRQIRSDGFQLTRDTWSLQARTKTKAQAQPNPTQPVWLSFRATQRSATTACSVPSGSGLS